MKNENKDIDSDYVELLDTLKRLQKEEDARNIFFGIVSGLGCALPIILGCLILWHLIN